jgi:hypothetical protein
VEAIRSVVNGFDSSGIGAEVFVSQKKIHQYCHVGMRSAADAQDHTSSGILASVGSGLVWMGATNSEK